MTKMTNNNLAATGNRCHRPSPRRCWLSNDRSCPMPSRLWRTQLMTVLNCLMGCKSPDISRKIFNNLTALITNSPIYGFKQEFCKRQWKLCQVTRRRTWMQNLNFFLKKMVVSIRRDRNTNCIRMYTIRSGKLLRKKTHHNEPAIMLIRTVEIRKQINRLANPIRRECHLIKQTILVFKTNRSNIRCKHNRNWINKCFTRRNSSVKQIRKCRI